MAQAKKIIPDISSTVLQEYLNDNGLFGNKRELPDNVSFWDAILSEDADFTQTPEGKRIINLIKGL